MHTLQSSPSRALGGVFVFLVPLLVACLTPSASAQLTAEDIKEMKERGIREGWTFEVSLNEATQYPLEQLCGAVEPPNWRENATWLACTPRQDFPVRFDWRELDGVTPIKNQERCGSCWAFAAAGQLELAIKFQDRREVDLSEQWLVSCNQAGWSCLGGWWAHNYFLRWEDDCDSSGAVLEEDFPYVGEDVSCTCPVPHPFHINSWGYVGTDEGVASVDQMKQALLDYGPLGTNVYTGALFHAYSGGVFNACSEGQTNHLVVIVGWDDTLGTQGCWILRNSWGAGWGDHGYMYIPYYCNMVGYCTVYIDYRGGASFTSDISSGWVPFDVAFEGRSGYDVVDWLWDFGDNTSDTGQTPLHTYLQPGVHTVGLQVDIGGELRYREEPDFIVALADTLKPQRAGGLCNGQVVVPVLAHTTASLKSLKIPVVYDGDVDLRFDSFSTVGCRTEYFEHQSVVNQDSNNKRFTIRLLSSAIGSSPDLAPGDGPIANLYFTIPWQVAYGDSTPIDVSGYPDYPPEFAFPLLSYAPRTTVGSVTLSVQRGDLDGLPGINVSDLTWLTAYLFSGGMPPYPPGSGDVDCSSNVDISDLTYLVAYLFGSGPQPAFCF